MLTTPKSLFLDPILKRLADCLESEMAENFLAILLDVMRLVFLIDSDFRRNIDGFEARYQFRSVDDSITVGVTFHDGRMEVEETLLDQPNITIIFKDGRALMGFLLTPKPDILGAMLRQEVSTSGNLNYLMKFGFMAQRLILAATGRLSPPGGARAAG